jgi:hypothetical protein
VTTITTTTHYLTTMPCTISDYLSSVPPTDKLVTLSQV